MRHSTAICLVLCSALAGCGGGATGLGPGAAGGGGSGGGGGTSVVFGLFNNTADATSVLGGNMLVATDTSLRTVSADLAHRTRVLDGFTDGTTTFSDTSGDTGGVWTDGTNSLDPSAEQQGSYTFARIYNLSTPTNGSGPVVLGVTTPSSLLPTTGSATFTGEALVDGATLNDGVISASGVSTVSVNFAALSAEAQLQGFTAATPFSTIAINGMVLDPATSRLSGGTVALQNGGANITTTVIGNETANDAAATLFGADSAGTGPDEIGGVFAIQGSDGTISGGFLAD